MADALIGTTVDGKYRILSLLGQGGMGEVYRAEQLDLEGEPLREVALKMIRFEYSQNPSFAQRFLREVRVTTRLQSPHAITVYDIGRTSNLALYFVMEYMQGETLRTVIDQNLRLPPARVVHIVGQVCEALAEAHGLPQPIIHRDMKPGNIFVSSQSQQDWVKVGDFGIAKVLGEHTSGLTQTGASLGTPRYMAPEQWMGKEVDGRADLYALGVMMYEMLAGQPPFLSDEGPMALMYQHLNKPPPPLPDDVPDGIRHQIEQILAKDPEERPSSALAVKQELEAALVSDGSFSHNLTGLDQTLTQDLPSHEHDKQPGRQWTFQPDPSVDTTATRASSDNVTQQQEQPARFPRIALSIGFITLLLAGGLWYVLHSQQLPLPFLADIGDTSSQPTGTESRQPRVPQDQQNQQASPAAAPEPAPRQPEREETRDERERTPEPRLTSETAELDEPLEKPSSSDEEYIALLFDQAQQHISAKRLTSPQGRNAFEAYQDILRRNPDHQGALDGIASLKEKYVRWAEAEQKKADWDAAKRYYERALLVAPNDSVILAALDEAQAQHEQEQQEQAQREQEENEEQKLARLLALAEERPSRTEEPVPLPAPDLAAEGAPFEMREPDPPEQTPTGDSSPILSAAPRLARFTPHRSSLALLPYETRFFGVQVETPGALGASLTYRWYVDEQQVSNEALYKFKDYSIGQHTVRIAVSAPGGRQVTHRWSVEVYEPTLSDSFGPIYFPRLEILPLPDMVVTAGQKEVIVKGQVRNVDPASRSAENIALWVTLLDQAKRPLLRRLVVPRPQPLAAGGVGSFRIPVPRLTERMRYTVELVNLDRAEEDHEQVKNHLLRRVERAKQQRNWKEAAALLITAIRVYPPDERELLKALEEVQRKQARQTNVSFN